MSQQDFLTKVSSGTNVGTLGKSIYEQHKNNPSTIMTLRVIGAGALNQAIKGVVCSNEHFAKDGKLASVLPSFCTLDDKTVCLNLKIQIQNV